MKKSLTIAAAVAVVSAFTIPALAGSTGVQVSRTGGVTQADNATIAQLQAAAERATQDGRNGNKNNLEFARKNYQIDQLIERLESGQHVEMSEIDQALVPARVW